MGRLANLYLFTYNAAQAFGWTVALIRIVSNVSTTKSVDGAYAAAGDLICLLQYAAFMEVLHAAIVQYDIVYAQSVPTRALVLFSVSSNIVHLRGRICHWEPFRIKCRFSLVMLFAVGLVPSGVFPILMQWGGRTHFVAAIVCQITEV
eukprot:Gb_33561 [translate_table: standard]